MTLVTRIVTRPGSPTAQAVVVPPASGGTTDPSGVYDYLIGDIPFVGGLDDTYPYHHYTRATAQFRKEQVDTSTEPGEQSINAWWLRSQSSFHCGAGRQFNEQRDSTDTVWQYQFQASQGVDVWTQGQVSLLKACGLVSSTASLGGILGATDVAGNPVLLGWSGATLTKYSLNTSTEAVTSSTITWGGTGSITDVVTDGSNYYVASIGGIFSGAIGAGVGTLLYNSGTSVKLGWVKQRLIAGIDNALYELTVPPVSGANLPTPNYKHPNATWVWTSIAEGPDAIYASGFAGGNSSVFKMLLDTTVDPPQLTPGIVAASLPYGEIVRSLTAYMGGYLVLGTNVGIRVCEITTSNDGSFYLLAPSVLLSGPLAQVGALPCLASMGDDRFIYAGYGNALADGTSGLVRIDLSQLTDAARFAWATDLQSHASGNVAAVTHWGTRKAFLVQGSGVYFEKGSVLEPSGYLTTGRVRYHTLEPKLFKFLRMRAAPLQGGLQAAVYDSAGVSNLLALVNTSGLADIAEQPLTLPAQEYVSVRFTLFSDVTNVLSPTFRGYQVKALPAAKRQRQEVFALSCYDREQDRDGNMVGTDGWAWSRLQRLEALEEAADAVVVQHLAADPEGRAQRLVVIDSVQFTQKRNPSQKNGWGGVIDLTVRSIT